MHLVVGFINVMLAHYLAGIYRGSCGSTRSVERRFADAVPRTLPARVLTMRLWRYCLAWALQARDY